MCTWLLSANAQERVEEGEPNSSLLHRGGPTLRYHRFIFWRSSTRCKKTINQNNSRCERVLRRLQRG